MKRLNPRQAAKRREKMMVRAATESGRKFALSVEGPVITRSVVAEHARKRRDVMHPADLFKTMSVADFNLVMDAAPLIGFTGTTPHEEPK